LNICEIWVHYTKKLVAFVVTLMLTSSRKAGFKITYLWFRMYFALSLIPEINNNSERTLYYAIIYILEQQRESYSAVNLAFTL